MLVKVYNWLVTLFYFYLTYRGVLLIFLECDEKRFNSIIFQYGFENKHKYLSIWVSVKREYKMSFPFIYETTDGSGGSFVFVSKPFLQTLYFVIVSFSDIVDSLPTLFRCSWWSHCCYTVRHYLLTSLVLPLTLYIFVVFWMFFLYDREAIYPELFDRFIPPWLNHAMHTYPVPILVVHLIICPNNNPSRKSALVGLTLVFVVYGIIFWLSVMRGNWVYLLFNHLNPSQRMLLLSVSYPLTIFFLILSRWLNASVKGFKQKYLSMDEKDK